MAGTGGGYTVGVDVGGTKVLGLGLDPDRPHEPLALEVVPTPPGAEHLVTVVLSVVAALSRRIGRPPSAVGVGVAGLLDLAGTLRVAPNLVGDDGFAVVGRLRAELDVPVVIDNDANCAAAAELAAGAAAGRREFAYIALGTGIGGAVVTSGAVLRGANGFAGEAGHMTVVPGGLVCACGRLGCWEAYASGTGLARLGRQAVAEGRGPSLLARAGGDVAALRGEHVTGGAVAGDPDAVAVVEEFGRWVAIGLSNLVSLLDPGLIVLGGTMVEVGDVLLHPVRAAMAELVLGPAERGGPPVVAAAFGARSAAVGAALLAVNARGRPGSGH